ncbi:MAG: hypothetical protein H7A51_04130 [Akkermansiaceae bacterium]|nr:hypothetical protein [Akkermansiaceae bacterium]
MDKLYYIVCEDKETTLFEGRYQGRTRGAALKFLKQSLGRKSLNGLVFTITEIPVPLIREIVTEILAGGDGTGAANVVPIKPPEPEPPAGRYDAFADAAEPDSPPAEGPAPKKHPKKKRTAKVGNPGLGEAIWSEARAFWKKCRSIKQTADKFGLSPNSVKTRARREKWREEA